jgi:hypothetical protein
MKAVCYIYFFPLFSSVLLLSAFISCFFLTEVNGINDTLPSLIGFYTRFIVLGLSPLIILVEYPRSRKRNGKMPEPRFGQQYIAPVIRATYFIGGEYIIRFVFYAIICAMSFTLLSLISGGMCLFCGAAVYCLAAFFGEKWRAPDMAWGPWKNEGIKKSTKTTRGGTMSHPPAQPPPRAPGKGTLPPAPMAPPPKSPPPRAI